MGSELEATACGRSGRTAAGLGPMSNTDSSKRRRFAIALSFPGERREYVEQVANALLPAFGGEKSRIFMSYRRVDSNCTPRRMPGDRPPARKHAR